ncbi:type VII secretion target [Dactylosporangium sp. NBC_01737]|uniref:type VII secretion target n=1 Tax=Dactylosporangium sp. NBC_01737 TaxID=2975959 RepID=UPI002E0EE497|nr:type VII secretion target [Dactylosporangium sp. NBC_01737]
MGEYDSSSVDTGQLRTHARNIETINARFGAVKAASAHIAQDDAAYGLLCGWMAGILEGRHTRQDELIAYAEENLTLIAAQLRKTAYAYDGVEADNKQLIGKAHRVMDAGG